MARPILLGNGSLTVGLNEHGLVHDFYYPYVGLDNLTTARSTHHLIGVWVDGQFSWVENGDWDIQTDFEQDALIGCVRMRSERLAVELVTQDFVDYSVNAFCRAVEIKNLAEHAREIRVFFHQVFEISRAGRADTALYDPDGHYILDYKGRCCLLVYAQDRHGKAFDQFATGNYGIEGKEGTFKDAEDGELSGGAVEHGGVDSVLRFARQIEGRRSGRFDYWIAAADSQHSAEKIHELILSEGLRRRLNKTREYWHGWLETGASKLKQVDPKYRVLTKKSLMLIKAHTDRRGGIIASCDSSIYNYGRDYYSYVWPRDGAYAIWPLIRLGYTEEPKRFFEFCRDIISPDGFMMHKYQPDKAIGSTWHPLLHGKRKELAIQEDETAGVIFMLGEYYEATHDDDFVRSLYTTLIQPAANFMEEFVDEDTGLPHASYDLWEEKFLTTTYTVSITYQALLVAARFADKFEYPDDAVRWKEVAERIHEHADVLFDHERGAYRKGYLLQEDGSMAFDNTLDSSSFYGVMMYSLSGKSVKPLHDTVRVIEEILLTSSPQGGCPRYEYDHYFESNPAHLGNPWIITTLWLAQYYTRIQQQAKAEELTNWVVGHTWPSGVMSEQIDPNTGLSVGVTPLVWSHAEFVNTVLDLAKVD